MKQVNEIFAQLAQPDLDPTTRRRLLLRLGMAVALDPPPGRKFTGRGRQPYLALAASLHQRDSMARPDPRS